MTSVLFRIDAERLFLIDVCPADTDCQRVNRYVHHNEVTDQECRIDHLQIDNRYSSRPR